MICLNKDGGDSEREFIKLSALDNRKNRDYSKTEPAPIKMRSKHEEQSKIKQKRAYYQLGYQYAQNGDDVSAITQFEMVLEYDPHDKDSNYNLGYLYAKTGRYEKAVEAYSRALELSSDPEDSQIYYNLALIYDENLKDREKSSQYYKKFLGR
jgi:tetratricopeptide (TPR) repeat protein